MLKEGSDDIAIKNEFRQAEKNERDGNIEAAIGHYKEAVNILRDQGEVDKLRQYQLRISMLMDCLQQYEEARDFLADVVVEKSDTVLNSSNDDPALIIDTIGGDLASKEKFMDALKIERENLKQLSQSYARSNDKERSEKYFAMYQQLSSEMEEDSIQMAALNAKRESEMLLLRQQKEIADLNIEAANLERERQVRLRNTSAIVAPLVLIGSIIVGYFYFSKRKQHKKLSLAYADLDATKTKLETAEQRIKKLLGQQVSGEIAEALLAKGTDAMVEKIFACIMFLDIRDYTPMAEKKTPE